MKFLVELSHSHFPADYILSELHLEFGRAPELTGDPDILKLRMSDGTIAVLCDYERNRVWITLETDSDQVYRNTCQRIEQLLDRNMLAGKLHWNQIALAAEEEADPEAQNTAPTNTQEDEKPS
ncbi:MAG: hypothetical protein HC915_05890 [Anaerolineae bacterium]|nr:hypothetical protein [Anaerolineae bacterium]